MSKKYC